MKRLLYLLMAALIVLAVSCKKDDPNSPAGKQWVISPSSEGGIIVLGEGADNAILDLSLEGGKGVWDWSCSRAIRSDITYLYSDADMFDYAIVKDGDEWVLSMHWPEWDEVYRIRNITSSSGQMYQEDDDAWLYDMKKQSYKLEKTSNMVKLKWTYSGDKTESSRMLTNDSGLKAMTSLAGISSTFKPLIIDGEGAVGDYQGKEATMTIVVLKQNKGLMSIADKRRVAAERGALALILYACEGDAGTVFTKEMMNSLPTDDGIPVFFLARTYWVDNYLDQATSFSFQKI